MIFWKTYVFGDDGGSIRALKSFKCIDTLSVTHLMFARFVHMSVNHF